MPTDDDDARRAARGTTERMTGKWPAATPGIPVGKLQPPGPRAHPSDEPTRNDLPTGRRPAPRPTLKGLPPPPPPSGDTTLQSTPEAETTPVSGRGSAPPQAPRQRTFPETRGSYPEKPDGSPQRRQEPARKDSPPEGIPVSMPEQVLLSDKGLRLKLTWAQVRSWLLVLGVFGGLGGIGGWFAGLKAAGWRVARMEARQDAADELATKADARITKLDGTVKMQSEALAGAAESNGKAQEKLERTVRELRGDLEKRMPAK